jgi:hypothetical protein
MLLANDINFCSVHELTGQSLRTRTTDRIDIPGEARLTIVASMLIRKIPTKTRVRGGDIMLQDDVLSSPTYR